MADPPTTLEFKLPELGENIENGDVVKVLVREGDTIGANDGVIELETDKAVVEIPCPHAGKVTKVHVSQGQTVNVGQTLLTVEAEEPVGATGGLPTSAEETLPEPPQPLAALQSPTPTSDATLTPAGPATRRLARELNIDLQTVQGSGRHGRITPDDVRRATGGVRRAPDDVRRATGGLPTSAVETVEETPASQPPGEPDQDTWGPIRRERMSKIRRTIAAQMVKSVATIPHVTNFDDADVTDLEHVRKNVPPEFLGESLKLTMMPPVLKAVALALQRHPRLNATLDDQHEQVVYREYVNIGIAVDTPRGLVVPVLRNVDRMSIPEIARQLKTLAERARSAQFAVEDLRGGTFTISNLGAVGGTYSTPIINHPEAAILLLGRSRWMPAVRDGKIEPRLMLPLSLSYDHRLIDGAAAGRFLNEVIDWLESPGKLLLANA